MSGAPLAAAWTRNYLRVPFLDGGRDPEGWDCWGLVVWLAWFRDRVRLPSLRHHYRKATSARETQAVAAAGVTGLTRIGDSGEQAGDVAHFRGLGGIAHVGYVVAPGWILHVARGVLSSLCEFRADPIWKDRLLGIYRHDARL